MCVYLRTIDLGWVLYVRVFGKHHFNVEFYQLPQMRSAFCHLVHVDRGQTSLASACARIFFQSFIIHSHFSVGSSNSTNTSIGAVTIIFTWIYVSSLESAATYSYFECDEMCWKIERVLFSGHFGKWYLQCTICTHIWDVSMKPHHLFHCMRASVCVLNVCITMHSHSHSHALHSLTRCVHVCLSVC